MGDVTISSVEGEILLGPTPSDAWGWWHTHPDMFRGGERIAGGGGPNTSDLPGPHEYSLVVGNEWIYIMAGMGKPGTYRGFQVRRPAPGH